MDDQYFGDDLSLESLIEHGLVTHTCAGDRALVTDETALLTALCAAVAGQIYRIDDLTYVFRIAETDLEGTLATAPLDTWADLLADRLRTALLLTDAPGALQVHALRGPTADDASDVPEPAAAESESPEVPAWEVEDAAAAPAHVDTAERPDTSDDLAEAEPAAEDAGDQSGEEEASAEAAEVPPGEDDAEPELQFPPLPVAPPRLPDPEVEDTAAAEAPADLDRVLARLDGFAAVLDRIETAAAGEQSATRTAGLERRLAAVESGLAAAQAGMAQLAQAIAAEAAAAGARENSLIDLARDCRAIHKRAAEFFAARSAEPDPVVQALAEMTRSLEDHPAPQIDLAPFEARLADLRQEIDALPERLAGALPPTPDLAPRLDALDDTLRRLPDVAAADISAQATALMPVHAALSGALNRLDRQVESLLARAPAPAGIDPALTTAMAEFLSRLEMRLGAAPAD